MEVNENLKKEILSVVNNQLKNNDPPETKLTYNRLIKEGFSDIDAKKLIGNCVLVEIYDIMKSNKPFDIKRYVKNLEQLPKEPFD